MAGTSREDDPDPREITLAMSGDRAAVTELTRRFLPRVYGLCYRISGNRSIAEEATQETFVRALKALPSLRQATSFRSWLLMIAANTTRELWRKQPASKSLEEEPLFEPAEEPAPNQRQQALQRALADLPAEDRQVFLLHSMEGVSLATLARDQSASPQAMKSRVHRIRTRVRERARSWLQEMEGRA